MTCLNFTNPNNRAQLEDDILFMVENDITYLLVFFTPTYTPDELIDKIGRQVMERTSMLMSDLTTDDLRSDAFQRFLIRLAVGHTWRLIDSWVTL